MHLQARKSVCCELIAHDCIARGGEAPQGRIPPHGAIGNVGVERECAKPDRPRRAVPTAAKSAREERSGTPSVWEMPSGA